MSALDLLLLAALICGVFAAIRALRRGGGSCGGCNGDCGSCHKCENKHPKGSPVQGELARDSETEGL